MIRVSVNNITSEESSILLRQQSLQFEQWLSNKLSGKIYKLINHLAIQFIVYDDDFQVNQDAADRIKWRGSYIDWETGERKKFISIPVALDIAILKKIKSDEIFDFLLISLTNTAVNFFENKRANENIKKLVADLLFVCRSKISGQA